GAGDEALGTVDDVVVAVAHRGGAHGARIGTGLRLGLREAALALAAGGRDQIALAHLALEGVERRPDIGSENADHPGRQRDGAAELGPDDGMAEHAEALAAELLGHADLPQAQFLAARGEAGFDVGLELLSVERLSLDRNELLVDE